MALIKEDGTNVPNANSYEDVAGLKAYFLERGFTFSGTDSAIEAQLVQATDFVDLMYYKRFPGNMQFDDQTLQFPRDTWLDSIPDALRFATSEFARVAINDPLFFSPTLDDSGKRIIRKKEQVGPIIEETVFSDGGGTDASRKVFHKAERWLSFLLINSGGGVIR